MSSYNNIYKPIQFTKLEAIDALNKSLTKKANKDIGKEIKEGDEDFSGNMRYDKFLQALEKLKRDGTYDTSSLSQSIENSGTTDNFWENLRQSTSLPTHNNSSTITTTTTTNNNYISMDLQEILKLTGLDKYIRQTSGYDPSRQNIHSHHRRKDEYGHSMAYDIVPQNGYTFEQMLQEIKNNEQMIQWLDSHGFNISDETSERARRLYNATGPHYHISQNNHEKIYEANKH